MYAGDGSLSTHADLLAEVRKRTLTLPEVTEGLTHGAPTWFVRGRRSFAKFVDPEVHPRLHERYVAVWSAAPAGARQELIAASPDRFFDPPFGGADWVGTRLDLEGRGTDWDEVGEVLTDAYRHVAPRASSFSLTPMTRLVGPELPPISNVSGTGLIPHLMRAPAVGLGAVDIGESVLPRQVS